MSEGCQIQIGRVKAAQICSRTTFLLVLLRLFSHSPSSRSLQQAWSRERIRLQKRKRQVPQESSPPLVVGGPLWFMSGLCGRSKSKAALSRVYNPPPVWGPATTKVKRAGHHCQGLVTGPPRPQQQSRRRLPSKAKPPQTDREARQRSRLAALTVAVEHERNVISCDSIFHVHWGCTRSDMKARASFAEAATGHICQVKPAEAVLFILVPKLSGHYALFLQYIAIF